MLPKEREEEREMEMEVEGEMEEEQKEERAVWNGDHDHYLTNLVVAYGSQNWTAIAEDMDAHFPDYHKSGKQCRERWYNKLDPNIKHAPWTRQEEAALILYHMKLKNRWADIACKFSGRNNNTVKNRFYSIFRKIKNKTKNNDFSYSSRLELIEMHYMISVMEEYAANPLPPDQPKRKRGKDFMYTLIEDLDMSLLLLYKQQLLKRCPLSESLEAQLEQLSSVALHNPAASAVRDIPMGFRDLSESQGNFVPQRSPNSRCVDCASPRSASPTRRHLLTLPEPNSFNVKEALTPEDKEFVKANAFKASVADPSMPSLAAQCPVALGLGAANVGSFQGYYSSGTGPGHSNLHVAKGGFADYSHGVLQPAPGFPAFGYSPLRPAPSFRPSLFSPSFSNAGQLAPPP